MNFDPALDTLLDLLAQSTLRAMLAPADAGKENAASSLATGTRQGESNGTIQQTGGAHKAPRP
jgi:hypothetical protein